MIRCLFSAGVIFKLYFCSVPWQVLLKRHKRQWAHKKLPQVPEDKNDRGELPIQWSAFISEQSRVHWPFCKLPECFQTVKDTTTTGKIRLILCTCNHQPHVIHRLTPWLNIQCKQHKRHPPAAVPCTKRMYKWLLLTHCPISTQCSKHNNE